MTQENAPTRPVDAIADRFVEDCRALDLGALGADPLRTAPARLS